MGLGFSEKGVIKNSEGGNWVLGMDLVSSEEQRVHS